MSKVCTLVLWALVTFNPLEVVGRRIRHAKYQNDSAATNGAVTPENDQLIIMITEDTSQAEKMRIQSSNAFQAIWPVTCEGTREDGEILTVETDGFRCHQGSGIAELTDVSWKQSPPPFVCCQNQCMAFADFNANCKDDAVHSLPSAVGAAELAVHTLETGAPGENNAIVEVEVEDEQEIESDRKHEEAKEGKLITVRTDKDPLIKKEMTISFTLPFEGSEVEFDESHKDFFKDMKELISIQVTTQLTILQDPNIKILLCPHVSTGQMSLVAGTIPQQRAEVMRTMMLEANILSHDLGEIGQAFGHHRYEEGTKFDAGRKGLIMAKFYHSMRPKPKCALKDLHTAKHHFRWTGLPGLWLPVATKHPMPEFWEGKMIQIVRRAHPKNSIQLALFKGKMDKFGKPTNMHAKSEWINPNCTVDEANPHVFDCTFSFEYLSGGGWTGLGFLGEKFTWHVDVYPEPGYDEGESLAMKITTLASDKQGLLGHDRIEEGEVVELRNNAHQVMLEEIGESEAS